MEIVLEKIRNPSEKGSYSALGIRSSRCLTCPVVDENSNFGFFYISEPKLITDLTVTFGKEVEFGSNQTITLNYTTNGMFEGDGVGIDLASGWTSTPNTTCSFQNDSEVACASSQPTRLTLFALQYHLSPSQPVYIHVTGLKAPHFLLSSQSRPWTVFTFATELAHVNELGNCAQEANLVGKRFTDIAWKPTFYSDISDVVPGLQLFMNLSFNTVHQIPENGYIEVTFSGVRMDSSFCSVFLPSNQLFPCLIVNQTTLRIANLPEIPAKSPISILTLSLIIRTVSLTMSSFSEGNLRIDQTEKYPIPIVWSTNWSERVEMDIEFIVNSTGEWTQLAGETVTMKVTLGIGSIVGEMALFCPFFEGLTSISTHPALKFDPPSLVISNYTQNSRILYDICDLKLPKNASSASTAYQCVLKHRKTVVGSAAFHIQPRPWDGGLITRCGAKQMGAPVTFYLGNVAANQSLDFLMTNVQTNFQARPVNYPFSTNKAGNSGGMAFVYSGGNRFTLSNLTTVPQFVTFPLPDVSKLQEIQWEVTVYFLQVSDKLVTHQSRQPLVTTLITSIKKDDSTSDIVSGVDNSVTVELDIPRSEKGYVFAVLPRETIWKPGTSQLTSSMFEKKPLEFVYSTAGASSFTSSLSPANVTLAHFTPPVGVRDYTLQFGAVSLSNKCLSYLSVNVTSKVNPGTLTIDPQTQDRNFTCDITLPSGSKDNSKLVFSLNENAYRSLLDSEYHCSANINDVGTWCLKRKDGMYEVDLGTAKNPRTVVNIAIWGVLLLDSTLPFITLAFSETAEKQKIDQLN